MCVECRCYLSLGEVYWRDEKGKPLGETRLEGVFSTEDGRPHSRDEFFGRVLEKYLLIHRNHELRFVPEGVDELFETDAESVDAVEAQDVLRLPEVQPDGEVELQSWTQKRGNRV